MSYKTTSGFPRTQFHQTGDGSSSNSTIRSRWRQWRATCVAWGGDQCLLWYAVWLGLHHFVIFWRSRRRLLNSYSVMRDPPIPACPFRLSARGI